MSDESMARFAEIQAYAEALGRMIKAAQAQEPQHVEAANRGGAVRVRLGADGLPESFRVARDWDREITPDAFGDAVVEACQAAAAERIARWSRSLDEQGWQHEVERLRARSANVRSGLTPGRVQPRTTAPPRQPRRPDLVIEDVISVFDEVGRVSAQLARPAEASGSAAGGMLTLALSGAGLTTCSADPDWVARQTGARLTGALAEALRAARLGLARGAGGARPAAGLDALLAEAMALLSDPVDRLSEGIHS